MRGKVQARVEFLGEKNQDTEGMRLVCVQPGGVTAKMCVYTMKWMSAAAC